MRIGGNGKRWPAVCGCRYGGDVAMCGFVIKAGSGPIWLHMFLPYVACWNSPASCPSSWPPVLPSTPETSASAPVSPEYSARKFRWMTDRIGEYNHSVASGNSRSDVVVYQQRLASLVAAGHLPFQRDHLPLLWPLQEPGGFDLGRGQRRRACEEWVHHPRSCPLSRPQNPRCPFHKHTRRQGMPVRSVR